MLWVGGPHRVDDGADSVPVQDGRHHVLHCIGMENVGESASVVAIRCMTPLAACLSTRP